MSIDLATSPPQIVGYVGDEPVFDSTHFSTSRPSAPVEHEEGDICLACLFSSLIDPLEEMEAFVHVANEKLQHLSSVRIDCATTELHVKTERAALLPQLALASEAMINLKALLATAAQVFSE